MKKKYVAVMLGLVLSMSTASVYAAGSSAATAAESTDSSSDSSNVSRAKNQTASRRQNRMETTVSRQQGRNRTENHRRVMDREDPEVHLADRSRQLNIKSRKSFP